MLDAAMVDRRNHDVIQVRGAAGGRTVRDFLCKKKKKKKAGNALLGPPGLHHLHHCSGTKIILTVTTESSRRYTFLM